MTVEQTSPVEHYFNGPNHKEALSQLKELTGVQDTAILGQALEASKTEAGKYDVTKAFYLLVEENSRYMPHNKPQQCCSPKMRHNTPNEGAIIDLTNESKEKEDDLQKAIALSLQEQGALGGQVTVEEQDISRVLEVSLAESKAAGTKRKRGEVWQDPINPHDRKRNGDWPVGLKNVGNTCWFSAVIQSLFHLPVFRHLVLKFTPQKDWDSDVRNTSERRNILFMQELRKLFALMIGTNRKYVDPSQALEVLKEAFPNSGGTDSQQDVSEFSHKLLEWLEDAFKLDSAVSDSQPKETEGKNKSSNPMLNLFYGHFRSEGSNEGHTFSNEEPFGQYPLQVNGFSDIHESLEAAMAQEIETDCIDAMQKSGQETWFTQLPPVLLFELSRFQFNQQLGRPEKIHNKLEFPEVIYMDRYMECNKTITRHKREEVSKLKEERSKLQVELEKYLNFGSGSKRVPLQVVLQYTLEFVENRPLRISSNTSLSADDVEMASPASITSMATDSPCSSPHKASTPDNPGNQSSQTSSVQLLTAPLHNSSLDKSQPVGQTAFSKAAPSPRHISETEFSVIQDCLRRWRTEVEKDVKELQDHISEIDNTIKEIYNEPSLQKMPYRLHAVLVHEGQAASGHYWAYIFNPHRSLWLKFNDITVTEASWEELLKESVGGHHHASAYCLMYVDKRRHELFGAKDDEGFVHPTLDVLSKDLQQYVETNNAMFLDEIARWDAEQSRKKDVSTMTNFAASGDADCSILAEKRTAQPCPLPMEHALLVFDITLAQVRAVSDRINKIGAEKGLDEVLKAEFHRIQMACKQDFLTKDPRLSHIGVYMLMNGACKEPYLWLALLEQFQVPDLDDDVCGIIIRQAALKRMAEYRNKLKRCEEVSYLEWHQDYNNFRKLVTFFVLGVEMYYKRSYQEALPYLVNACQLNTSLTSKAASKYKGLEPKLVSHYRRRCLLKLNQVAAEKFKSADLKVESEGLQLMDDYILPTNFDLSSNYNPDDNAALEEIRSQWCSMLGEEITRQKQEKLQDYLTKLLDPSNDMQHLVFKAAIRRMKDLEERYHTVLSQIISNSHLVSTMKC